MTIATGNPIMLDHLQKLRRGYETGDFEPFFPGLAEDCVYESQWVFTPLKGKAAIVEHLSGKGATLRREKAFPVAVIVACESGLGFSFSSTPEGARRIAEAESRRPFHPDDLALLLRQRNDDGGVNKGIVALRLDDAGHIVRFDICNTAMFRYEIAGARENGQPAMSGAVIGDIAGSTREGEYEKIVPKTLIERDAFFTDDTVLSCAVAEGLIEGLEETGREAASDPEAQALIAARIRDALKAFTRHYPEAGYGGRFVQWAGGDSLEPYNSFGNGAPMRASFAGWCAETLAEAELFGKLSARPTHNHPDAEEAAAVVAACIHILKTGGTKRDVLAYVRRHYDLSFTLDALRPIHAFNITAKGTLIAALACFLESASFAECVGLAISLGGDCDTLAAIAGSIAEAHYRIEPNLLAQAMDKLDPPLAHIMHSATAFIRKEGLWRPGERETDTPLRCRCEWGK